MFFVHLLPSDVVIICKNTKIAKRKVASTKDDKKYQVAEDLFDIIQLIKTKTDACSEIIQNILDTSAFRGKKTRVRELNTNKSSLNFVETTCEAIRTNAGKKSRVGYSKKSELCEQKHPMEEEIVEFKSEGLDHAIIESSMYKLKTSLKELKCEKKAAVVITPSKLDIDEILILVQAERNHALQNFKLFGGHDSSSWKR